MLTKENRRAPRHAYDSVLEILDQTGRLLTGLGRLVNVSSVGACFITVHPLMQGQRLYMRLRSLKEGVLEVPGRIVRVRKGSHLNLYGFEFDTLHAAPDSQIPSEAA